MSTRTSRRPRKSQGSAEARRCLPGAILRAPSLVTLAALLVLAAPVAGCGKGGKPKQAQAADPHRRGPLEGSILEAVRGMHESANREACDQEPETARLQLEIAEQLDAHTEELRKLTRDAPPSDRWKPVQVGPLAVLEPVHPPKPKPGLQSFASDWSEIFELYRKIKDTPIDASWLKLNRLVRVIIPDDQSRLAGHNVFLRHSHQAPLERSLIALRACEKDEACTAPALDPSDREFLASVPPYARALTALSESTGGQPRRLALRQLLSALESDYANHFAFTVNDSVRRRSATELVLPLDPGPLAEASARVSAYVESVWRSPGLSLRIEWREAGAAARTRGLYEVLLVLGAGGRSFVSYPSRKVNFSSGLTAGTFAHEIGHVLGFKDRYFTVWQPERCRYVTEYREEDLMSDSDLGSVVEADWKTLNERYPLPSPPAR